MKETFIELNDPFKEFREQFGETFESFEAKLRELSSLWSLDKREVESSDYLDHKVHCGLLSLNVIDEYSDLNQAISVSEYVSIRNILRKLIAFKDLGILLEEV